MRDTETTTLPEPEKQPTCKVVARRKGAGSSSYALYENGELWKTGNYPYMAGYVMDADNIESAIFEHEEEMWWMMEQELEEFASDNLRR